MKALRALFRLWDKRRQMGVDDDWLSGDSKGEGWEMASFKKL